MNEHNNQQVLSEPMPGAWKCDKCGFILQKNVLYTGSGSISADTSPLNEICPNDGQFMRPFTWREANEGLFNEVVKLRAELSTEKALRVSAASTAARFEQSADELMKQLLACQIEKERMREAMLQVECEFPQCTHDTCHVLREALLPSETSNEETEMKTIEVLNELDAIRLRLRTLRIKNRHAGWFCKSIMGVESLVYGLSKAIEHIVKASPSKPPTKRKGK